MKRKQILKYLLFCCFSAFLILLFCSRSSPLYVFNNWDDANSYFTMGKSLMNGLVLYRDVYDQKGPYLYLAYGLAWLISHRGFAGVFLLEIISFTAFLYYSFKIVRLYAGELVSLALTPVLGMCVCTSQAFYWGGSAEELFLPLISMGLFDCLDYLRSFQNSETDLVNATNAEIQGGSTAMVTASVRGSLLPRWTMVLKNAVAAGILMQIKYTWLGFYLAFALVFSLKLLSMGQGRRIFRYFFIFIGGILLSMVPWLIYFSVHGALRDWYDVYIYDNVFLYSHLSQEEGLIDALYRLMKLLYWQFMENPRFYAAIVLGLIGALVEKGRGVLERLAPWWLFLFTFLGIFYAGGSLQYYCLTLSVFAAVGFGYVGRIMTGVSGLVGKRPVGDDSGDNKIAPCAIMAVTAVAVSAAFAFLLTPNRAFMSETRESFFLFGFADKVNEGGDATLLNVNCLDAGLYTLTGIVPDCRYFQTNTLGIPVIEEGQREYVKSGRTDYLLVRDILPYTLPDFYEEVDSADYATNGVEHTYRLYRRR